ncbi:phosphoribosylglycinamide formyltransferase [Pseudomarimonas salicorniae]|uniref:Phosphoribosylglycinamide formyltransferase n=1 Tax=Pseudomarimonas salicorniae TaxID=2933270 RepID=A0ABT0GGK6_9GAMM|nr:phosphoribosylglycinamide formyltransferase [Lysobacter sp. CAU 1642]MCK7593674.1 phosphoribosylglycinamide formyltransferase [Lysobacter sp. CAU 1642]
MSAAARGPAGGARPYRIAVMASGRGSNFLALHAAASEGRLPVELVGVFSDKASAPVLERARERGVPAQSLSPKDHPDRLHFDLALLNAVAAVQPDLIVCAGYMRILDGRALTPWTGRMINIHPSLLPRHRGLHTHRRALEAGDAEHGASVHLVTAELDGGPVIAQAVVPVLAGDDEQRLAARVLEREHPLLIASVDALARGEVAWRDERLWHGESPLGAPLRLDASGGLRRAA